jgi:V8-like Glu-specific endopeptidase
MASYSTSTFPYNRVVLIESPDPLRAGYYLIGSGVVIGPHTILTASHVVYDIPEQLADRNIQLYPGWNNADPQLGPGNISTSYVDHYFQIGTSGSDSGSKLQSASDYAVIDTSYTFTSWMGVLTDYQGGTVHETGYPATAGGYQTDSIGTVSADPSYSVLDYGTLSTSPGNSGGPIWLDYNGSDDVAGIVSTSGYACQLTLADWRQIESWVSQDGYSLGTGGGGSGRGSDFNVRDTTTNTSLPTNGTPYSGPIAGLQWEYIYTGSDNMNVTANVPNVFIHTGSGEDALDVSRANGNNVLDGSTGSNFLVGGTGDDTFFVDDRNPSADIWSTVSNFHAGDAATIFGITQSGLNTSWADGQGASGYTGLTLHVTGGGHPTASLTLAGFSTADLSNGRISTSWGTEADGTPYLSVHANS